MGYVSGKVINLTSKLNSADTTLKANIDVGVGVGRIYFINDAQEEWLSYTSITASGSDFIYGGLVRGLSQTADPATAGTGKTWLAGNIGTIVAMHDQLFDRQRPEATTFATPTARDTSLGADGFATKNWVNIYVTSTGLHYNYNLSTNQWESVSTGTTTPNGSETVAGKYQEATQVETDAGTSTGSTSAKLVVTPTKLQVAITNRKRLFGDGSDGDLVVSGTTNINTNQLYQYNNLTINNGAFLKSLSTTGYIAIKVKGTLTLNGTIDFTGIQGTVLSNNSLGIDYTLGIGGAGGNGLNGIGNNVGFGVGGVGSSLGYGGGGGGGKGLYNGGNGGNGGAPGGIGGAGSLVAGGAGGTSAGGGGGGDNNQSAGGAGGNAYGNPGLQGSTFNLGQTGGGGGAGGNANHKSPILYIEANNIVGTGNILCNGLNGGNGGVGGLNGGTGFNGGTGGGGGGGGGGVAIIVYNNNTFTGAINTNGGAGGTPNGIYGTNGTKKIINSNTLI